MHVNAARQYGFTLIELMITVAIVGILAAIAYPSYTSHVQHGYRSEGIAMLSDAAARMERFYAQNNSYAATPNITALGYAASPAPSPTGKYNLSYSVAPTATTYTLQVVPVGAQATDPCGTLTLNQAGTQTTTSTLTTCFQ